MLVFAAIFVVVILLTILFVGIYKHKGKEKNRLTGRI